MTTLQIIFLVIFCVTIFVALICFAIVEISYQISLRRNNFVVKNIHKNTYKNLDKYQIDFAWWDKQNVKNVSIKSQDNLNLCAKIIEKNNNQFAVVVHGYGAEGSEMQQYAKMFVDFGFSVLVPDNRAHGKSEGKTITRGYKDKYDVLSWIKFVNKNYNPEKIVVLGMSMGGATVCMLSGLDLPKNVKAIISDCAYTNAYDILQNTQKNSALRYLPAMKMFNKYAKKRAGFVLKDADAISAVQKTKVPILYVHGNKDDFVPFYMQDLLYNNTPKNLRQKVVIENSEHAENLVKGGEFYKQEVSKFLDKYAK